MITVQFEDSAYPGKAVLIIALPYLPREDETVCFNYGSPGEFSVTVKEVIHIVKHTGLSENDPNFILRITK